MNTLNKGQKAVATWIYIGVGMLVIQVILGGITRLTGSGLSITEWNVITGALPPFNEQQWLAAFEKYKQTPQFQYLNGDFTLHDYKFIFFWEWFHRNWARLISVVLVAGFVYFLIKRYLKQEMVMPLVILFLLGALQGAIGWIMVKSGLTDDMVYVKPLKLALHFTFALGLICYAWWFALQLSVPDSALVRDTSLRRLTTAIILILFIQLVYGALMAGHKAATAAPTWPTINGQWIPDQLFSSSASWLENKITVHFIHRGLAYLLSALTIGWAVKAYRIIPTPLFRKTRWLPPGLVILQVVLGVTAVLTSPGIIPNRWGLFEWIAQLHQVTGMLSLLSMVYMLYMVRRSK
ncbi:MAG: COX15/CtaA family protein [Bacteroidetes bacterium]|nr:COX15/CtaA family protein [Bacteroidota bacterium]